MFTLGFLTGIALCCFLIVLEVLLIRISGKTVVDGLCGVVEGVRNDKKGKIIENKTLEALDVEEWVDNLPNK